MKNYWIIRRGFIDRIRKKATPYKYDDIENFIEDRAAIQLNSK
jgi:hypothetical protein